VLRTVAPTQLAAAAMLAAGGAVALSARPQTGLFVVVVCVIGAVGTVAAGCYQSAKAVARQEAAAGCAGTCASCTLSCGTAPDRVAADDLSPDSATGTRGA
jgi:hypothetical protein